MTISFKPSSIKDRNHQSRINSQFKLFPALTRQVKLLKCLIIVSTIIHASIKSMAAFQLNAQLVPFTANSIDGSRALEKLSPFHNIHPDAYLDPVSI